MYDLVAEELHENWNRFYDPGTGRYLSTEPMAQVFPKAGRWPAYAYAKNNPVNATDPSGQFTALGFCPNFVPALAYARSLAGCDGAPANAHSANSCACSQKISTCTHGCDVCKILQPGTPPLVLTVSSLAQTSVPKPARFKSGFTHQFKDPTKIGLQVSHVSIDAFLCVEPDLVPELGRTLLHEALHTCVQETGTDIADGQGLCDAQTIEDACD